MSDSGTPAFWPFVMFDPPSFKCPTRAVTRVFLHCSAWDGKIVGQQLAETINSWHLANGWRGVGYHFLVDHMGGVCTGRPLEEQPAAQLGPDQRGNIATIALMTNGLWDFTPEALQSTYMMCKAIDDAYKLANKAVTFHGHCEIDPKPCPVYDYKGLLGLDDAGHFAAKGVLTTQVVSAAAKAKAGDQWHQAHS